jgi:hypothetical protein
MSTRISLKFLPKNPVVAEAGTGMIEGRGAGLYQGPVAPDPPALTLAINVTLFPPIVK